jgi:hypothetical protein
MCQWWAPAPVRLWRRRKRLDGWLPGLRTALWHVHAYGVHRGATHAQQHPPPASPAPPVQSGRNIPPIPALPCWRTGSTKRTTSLLVPAVCESSSPPSCAVAMPPPPRGWRGRRSLERGAMRRTRGRRPAATTAARSPQVRAHALFGRGPRPFSLRRPRAPSCRIFTLLSARRCRPRLLVKLGKAVASPPPPAAPPCPLQGYSASEGQKERRLLLSELRNLVPPSHATLLAPILLDSGLAPPAPNLGAAAAGRERAEVARGRAARMARAAVLRQYPSLPSALLLEAARRLAGPTDGAAPPAGLPCAPGALGPAGSGPGPAAAGPGPQAGAAAAAASGAGGGSLEAARHAAAWCEVLLSPCIAAAQHAAAARLEAGPGAARACIGAPRCPTECSPADRRRWLNGV